MMENPMLHKPPMPSAPKAPTAPCLSSDIKGTTPADPEAGVGSDCDTVLEQDEEDGARQGLHGLVGRQPRWELRGLRGWEAHAWRRVGGLDSAQTVHATYTR